MTPSTANCANTTPASEAEFLRNRAAAYVVFMVAALLVGSCGAPPATDTSSETPRDARAKCPEGPLGRSFNETVPGAGQHDAKLLERAVLYYTNQARCQLGLQPLRRDGGVALTARNHAYDMARLNFFEHVSPIPERRTLSDRLGEVRVPYTLAAENIIEARYMAYKNRTRFKTIDAEQCLYTYSSGEPIARHNYRTLAKELVDRWLGSTGHRRNILDPNLTRHGFAIAPNRTKTLCGGLFGAQVFAG